jgi:hypothetical protein
MKPRLTRSLFLGYGAAALAAATLFFAGFGILPAVLVLWLGGAAATVGFAAIMISPSQALHEDSKASLEAWERDRLMDAAWRIERQRRAAD